MRASEFPEANTKLLAPKGMEDTVYDLPIWKDATLGLVISHWKPTWRDRIRILFGRPLWLHVQDPTHPPLSIETDYPFER